MAMNAGPLNMFVSLVVELYPQYLILLSLPYVDASYRCALVLYPHVRLSLVVKEAVCTPSCYSCSS